MIFFYLKYNIVLKADYIGWQPRLFEAYCIAFLKKNKGNKNKQKQNTY